MNEIYLNIPILIMKERKMDKTNKRMVLTRPQKKQRKTN